jgi:hypothetical protein
MTAFDQAWEIAKESGPPLNRFDDEGGQESMPKEGWQDFRIPNSEGMLSFSLPPAGNFPDMASGWYPTTRVMREPDGLARVTHEPAGSNINLHPLASILGERDPDYEPAPSLYDEEGEEFAYPPLGLTERGERDIIAELASTGHHESIHQAVHSLLREAGLYQGDPDYSRATEWAANLAMHHDPHRAWNQLMQHSQFRGDEEIYEIADKVLSR